MVRFGVAGVLRAAVRVWAMAWWALWRQDQWRAAAWAEEHCYGDMDGWVLFDAVGVGFFGVLQCFSECLEQLADVAEGERGRGGMMFLGTETLWVSQAGRLRTRFVVGGMG